MTEERTAMWDKADTVDTVNRTLNLGYRPSLRWVRRLVGKEKTNSDERLARQEDQNEEQH